MKQRRKENFRRLWCLNLLSDLPQARCFYALSCLSRIGVNGLLSIQIIQQIAERIGVLTHITLWWRFQLLYFLHIIRSMNAISILVK